MVYQMTGDPTLAERQRRFEFIKERRTRKPKPMSYEHIAKELAEVENREISRQAIHKLWSRGVVRPNGRPAEPQKKVDALQERILSWHAKRLSAITAGWSPEDAYVRRIDDRIAALQAKLVDVLGSAAAQS